jgi:hypothetical protein
VRRSKSAFHAQDREKNLGLVARWDTSRTGIAAFSLASRGRGLVTRL